MSRKIESAISSDRLLSSRACEISLGSRSWPRSNVASTAPVVASKAKILSKLGPPLVTSRLPVGIGASELCLADNLDALTAEDAQVLAAGQGVWYLVRADGLCRDGSWGLAAPGVERITTVCQ